MELNVRSLGLKRYEDHCFSVGGEEMPMSAVVIAKLGVCDLKVGTSDLSREWDWIGTKRVRSDAR